MNYMRHFYKFSLLLQQKIDEVWLLIVSYNIPMKLSIIIPTFNNQKGLEKCVKKVDEGLNVLGFESEIIIVFNGLKQKIQNPKSKILIKPSKSEGKSKIQTLKNIKNEGFAGACNQGAEKAKGEYLLFLNDDCFLEKNTLTEMVKFLDKNQKITATQPIIFSGIAASPTAPRNDKEIGYVVNLKAGKASVTTGEQSLEGLKVNRLTSSKVNIFEQGWVYGLSGTCLMIRKKIFEEIQGFDAGFHSYLEDVDLFIRLAKKNYYYSPTLTVSCFHEHMTTSSKMGNYKQKQDFKNWIRIIIKNYPFNFILKNFFSLFIERLRNLNGVLKSI